MTERAYDLVRALIERLGGMMVFQKEGFRHGAWILTLGEREKIIEAGGNRSFPELDGLYLPKVTHPTTWDDYKNELVPDVEMKVLTLFGLGELPEEEAVQLEAAVGRSQWKFAWKYARTWPHEYTVKAKSQPEDHALLIATIEKYGVRIPWEQYRSKYLFFQDRKYWHMGDPYSEDPEEQPNVINRAWLDVRRHRQNVAHVWTEEEVELQERLWEIQMEKEAAKRRPA